MRFRRAFEDAPIGICVVDRNLKVVRLADRGRRSVGPGVVEAFYAGLDTINLDDFPFLCKLDLDLDLPPAHQTDLPAVLAEPPRAGAAAGSAVHRAGRALRIAWHIRPRRMRSSPPSPMRWAGATG